MFRREVGRCTATLIRVLGDIDLAEDSVAEAFTAAAERWPVDGIPPNPGGWLTTTARNRAIDRLRREAGRDERHLAAHRLLETTVGDDDPHSGGDPERRRRLAALDELSEVVADDQLRLMFLCCHPALSADAQVALTLRLLGGLSTAEIARAFLVTESAMTRRITRAKRKLSDNRAPYRIPAGAELAGRLHAVLSAIGLVFTEGHRATSGTDLTRTDLTGEAIRLGRLVVELLPDEPEAVGLLALMLLTDARRRARIADDGSLVRLSDQDRSRWDPVLIAEGHGLVRWCLRLNRPGPFQIQAAIAAVHADAPTAAETDWSQIVALYDRLLALRPDPVVAVNRAVAVAELDGPAVGLAALDLVDPAPAEDYAPYHATRADLLARAGRRAEAVTAYERAVDLTTSPVERAFLTRRRDGVSDAAAGSGPDLSSPGTGGG